MTTRARHLTVVPACRPARPLGTDGTPPEMTAAEAAATAASLCDDLAALSEFGHDRTVAQLAALERGDMLTTVRCAMELRPTLRTLASTLGELHVLMDEAARTDGDAS